MASSPSSAKGSGPRRFGSESPRVFTPPLVDLTAETSAGFSVIEFATDVLGVDLLPWQRWLLIHALELLADGSFRFRTVVVLVARQSGKSTLGQVLALWFLYVRGVKLIIGTAQSLDTASEVWRGAVEIAEETEELAEEIRKITRLNSRETLELNSGSRYKVAAASRRAGRGLSGDLVLLDELREHQSWDAWGALTKTTMARENSMIWALSNAGDATSIVLRHLRKMAHAAVGDPDGIAEAGVAVPPPVPAEEDEDDMIIEDADPDSLFIAEWSAKPGCDRWDRVGWAQANPSMNYTLPERNIADAARTDPEWVFRTEVLCQWSEGSLEGPFPPGRWEDGQSATSKIAPDSPRVFGLDVSWDRSTSYIVGAGLREDGSAHVEMAQQASGTHWVVPWLTDPKRAARHGGKVTVVAQGRGGPVASLLDELRASDLVNLIEWQGSDLGAASGAFYDAVVGERLFHPPWPALDLAAATARTKPLGDGWGWDRRRSPNDASPLVAATGAVWHVLRPRDAPFRSAYEESSFVMV